MVNLCYYSYHFRGFTLDEILSTPALSKESMKRGSPSNETV